MDLHEGGRKKKICLVYIPGPNPIKARNNQQLVLEQCFSSGREVGPHTGHTLCVPTTPDRAETEPCVPSRAGMRNIYVFLIFAASVTALSSNLHKMPRGITVHT